MFVVLAPWICEVRRYLFCLFESDCPFGFGRKNKKKVVLV